MFWFSSAQCRQFAHNVTIPFAVAARLQNRNTPSQERLCVSFIAATKTAVKTRYGVQLYPHFDFEDYPSFRVGIVPGGLVEDALRCGRVRAWIERASNHCEILASVCNGAFLLAEVGLLDGRRASTHWEDAEELRDSFPEVNVVDDVCCDEGSVVTSAGISAGIDMSLHLVERLASENLARRTSRQLVYDWRRSNISM